MSDFTTKRILCSEILYTVEEEEYHDYLPTKRFNKGNPFRRDMSQNAKVLTIMLLIDEYLFLSTNRSARYNRLFCRR